MGHYERAFSKYVTGYMDHCGNLYDTRVPESMPVFTIPQRQDPACREFVKGPVVISSVINESFSPELHKVFLRVLIFYKDQTK